MKVYRYPARKLTGDYLRSATGLVVGIGLLLAGGSAATLVIGAGVAGLFGLFAYRTAQRHATAVAVTDEAIRDRGFRSRDLSWGELERLKLRYYGTKRQERGEGGFMQMTLKGSGASLTYDSEMEGFDFIAWRAAKAARENGVSIDPASAGNLLAMGLDVDRDTPPPEA